MAMKYNMHIKWCHNGYSSYQVVLPLVAAQMRELCPAHPLIVHCSLPASMLAAVQQMPWLMETPVARSATPAQHQEGGTPLHLRQRDTSLHLMGTEFIHKTAKAAYINSLWN